MTQIRSLNQPIHRRPGELGVHSLDRFNFAVPDVEQARKFYSIFGLDVREPLRGHQVRVWRNRPLRQLFGSVLQLFDECSTHAEFFAPIYSGDYMGC